MILFINQCFFGVFQRYRNAMKVFFFFNLHVKMGQPEINHVIVKATIISSSLNTQSCTKELFDGTEFLLLGRLGFWASTEKKIWADYEQQLRVVLS